VVVISVACPCGGSAEKHATICAFDRVYMEASVTPGQPYCLQEMTSDTRTYPNRL
jgi:hypothetical protein